MGRHLYKAWNEAQTQPVRYFAVQVEAAEDRWTATCREVDEDGAELLDAPDVAPRFYGVSAEQAHRRMRDILENTYDRVEPVTTRMED